MNKLKTVVIIPCYNCERTIQEVVKNTQKYCDNIIVVDDGSQDSSGKNALSVGASVISLGRNFGAGKATREGIQAGIQNKFEVFITLDADGSHLPSDIPNLLDSHIHNKNDLTIGDRWTISKSSELPSSKRTANYFATYLINTVLSTNITDVACGFRIFSFNAAKIISTSSTSDDFGFIYETINVIKQKKLKIGSSPINVRYDANQLFATGISELSAFLFACKKLSAEQDLTNKIDELIQSVEKFQVLSIYLTKTGINIIAHPVKEYSSYSFQFQNEFFISTYPTIEI